MQEPKRVHTYSYANYVTWPQEGEDGNSLTECRLCRRLPHGNIKASLVRSLPSLVRIYKGSPAAFFCIPL